jgi:hypothetical protein
MQPETNAAEARVASAIRQAVSQHMRQPGPIFTEGFIGMMAKAAIAAQQGQAPALAAGDVREKCDWPTGDFTYFDPTPDDFHTPCYVVMPGGASLSLAHHCGAGVDEARARFIIAACNAALAASPAAGPAVSGVDISLDAYDAGLLGDGGGGNVDWWQDYIRSLLNDAHEFYTAQVEAAITSDSGGAGISKIGVHLRTEPTTWGSGEWIVVSITNGEQREVEIIREISSGSYPDTIIDHSVTSHGIAAALALTPKSGGQG